MGDINTNRLDTCSQGSAFVKDAMSMLGLWDPDKIFFYDAPAQFVSPLPAPIGFIWLDDGKIRPATAPQWAVFERLLMVGGVVAFHDCWDKGGNADAFKRGHR